MRILALTLIAACSYSEPVGSSLLTLDAGSSTPADAADPHIVSDPDFCFFSQHGSDLYCVITDADLAATDSSQHVRVRRITAAGELVTEGVLAARTYSTDTSLAQDDGHVYFSALTRPETASDPAEWALFAFDKSAHTFAPVLTGSGADAQPTHLIAAGGDLYFFTYIRDTTSGGNNHSRMFSMSSSGGTTHVVTDLIGQPSSVIADDNYIYVSDASRAKLDAIELGANHDVLALVSAGAPFDSTTPFPEGLFLSGDWLYYSTESEYAPASLRRVPRPAAHATQSTISTTSELFATGMTRVGSITASSTDLYWTEYQAGLMRNPLDGTGDPVAVLTFGQESDGAIALLGDDVYFIARHPGFGDYFIGKYE